MQGIIKVISLFVFVSCYTPPTPIIIYPKPDIDVSTDMTIQNYLHMSTKYAIDTEDYIDELINQIKHKVPYIELTTDIKSRAEALQKNKKKD